MIETIIEDETGRLTKEIEKLLKKAVEKTAEAEGFKKRSEVDILIVDNKEMRIINNKYRKINSETDVLSFPMDNFEDGGILGDIVISIDKAKEQSIEYGHSFEREMGFLTVHGMLHLFGYDHESPEQEKQMIQKQEEILQHLHLRR